MNDNTIHETGPTAASEETAPCWRCGLAASLEANVCPHCSARLRSIAADPDQLVAGAHRHASGAVKAMLWAYGVLLPVGIVHALVMQFSVDAEVPFNEATRTRVYTQILIVEGIDSLIILGVLLFAPRPAPAPIPTPRTRIAAWTLLLPVLGGLLALNVGYHWVLRQLLRVPLITDELTAQIDILAIVALCVQPAVIEELFCRFYALDCLQEITSRHAAVWISAVMFGFMHVAMLPSIPYLIVIGAVFAYMRLASGTLLVPVIMHFVHNLVVSLMG